ncbi:uncharacterized protein Z518_08890 [Rhinocladiella mackenziei CBS 650.93]|uniref:Uncharacterized protein n=1 Tax=Rhinocladiella mackenziei CBS 650.93 TaxID=1442369 RepID=A0A0D2IX22_9EURO|nr:uncharacterized protein Z518_08890 [Rhinocladiella mackenziei CBS 650.93]KIX01165.1 hypothetical protein Z518_08890 [Rhinocladiella mackenziei CBS 650.93]
MSQYENSRLNEFPSWSKAPSKSWLKESLQPQYVDFDVWFTARHRDTHNYDSRFAHSTRLGDSILSKNVLSSNNCSFHKSSVTICENQSPEPPEIHVDSPFIQGILNDESPSASGLCLAYFVRYCTLNKNEQMLLLDLVVQTNTAQKEQQQESRSAHSDKRPAGDAKQPSRKKGRTIRREHKHGFDDEVSDDFESFFRL